MTTVPSMRLNVMKEPIKPHLSRVKGFWICSCESGVIGVNPNATVAYNQWKMFYLLKSMIRSYQNRQHA
jgi:hypothetical protein